MAREIQEGLILAFRNVNLIVPTNAQDKLELEEDLRQMGCEGFMARPWSLKDEEMVVELLDDQTNEWKGTVQALLKEWNAVMWCKVYAF